MVNMVGLDKKDLVVKYFIKRGDRAPCELWSLVETNFGGPAKNFIIEGTHNRCMQVYDQISRGSSELIEEP